MQRMRAIDLFCGTGGFSRGAHAAGFDVVAAYDLDPNLTYSFGLNFPDTKLHLKDIATLSREEILKDAGGPIDLIFGGPPCQGFSMIGRRNEKDPRRSLLRRFFEIVNEVRPSAFVMENVEGLMLGSARAELDQAISALNGYTVLKPTVLDASDFGAATKRRRAFVIGYLPDECAPFDLDALDEFKCEPATVQDAISDLKSPVRIRIEADETDVWRLRKRSKISDYAKSMKSSDETFTGNKRTVHLDRVVKRFSTIKPGGFDPIGKYPRLKWDGQCPTLRAGTGSDKGSHQAVRPIHPCEDRVITVREAARLQGFPDEHRFHPTIWHSFRQIGNSVSPIIGGVVLSLVLKNLESNIQMPEAAE